MNKIQIASNALQLLGDNPITALGDGTASSNLADAFYDVVYESLLTTHRWRFAAAKMTLSKLTATPLNEWDNAFQLPADFLVAIKVNYDYDYEIYEDKLYSNADSIDLDYTMKPSEGNLPSYFIETLELRLASKMAIPITENSTKADVLHVMYKDQLKSAKFIDSQARPNDGIVSSPFTEVRG